MTTTIPANACVRNALADDCNWQLIARTGPQAHFAIIVDQDPNGTPNDSTDDIITPLGWALLTGLDLTAGATMVNETLPQVAAADLVPFSAAFPALPAGMTYFNAYPAIELPGGAGRIPAVVPTLGPKVTMTSVPKLAGTTTVGLAGGSYDLLASAQATMTAAEPASLTWMHGVNATAPSRSPLVVGTDGDRRARAATTRSCRSPAPRSTGGVQGPERRRPHLVGDHLRRVDDVHAPGPVAQSAGDPERDGHADRLGADHPRASTSATSGSTTPPRS